MKKFLIPLILILILFIPAFVSASELELGMGYTPMFGEELDDDATFQESGLTSFHVGYSFWWLFYASWDSFIMPPYIVESMTGGFEEDPDNPDAGFVRDGYYRPGFLNMFDLGIRLKLGPVLAFAEMGINTLYVYRQEEDNLDIAEGLGANIRLGAGAHFGWWGVTVSISSIQPSIDQAMTILENISSSDPFLQDQAKEMFSETLVPSIMLVLYL